MPNSLSTFDREVKPHWTGHFPADYARVVDEEEQNRRGFGLRLKAARERRGMNQQQVADLFGVTKGAVSAWETGKGDPGSFRLARLAKLFDVSADALLWDDSLSPDAMKIAAQFDGLTDKQQSMFRTLWLAYFEQAKSDEEVGEHIKPPPPRRTKT